jgi:hypothetical protein
MNSPIPWRVHYLSTTQGGSGRRFSVCVWINFPSKSASIFGDQLYAIRMMGVDAIAAYSQLQAMVVLAIQVYPAKSQRR